jgi:hypothetical protein
MTIGHDNGNGCHFGASWCCRDASEMLQRCCGGAIAAPSLLLVGAKQGQDVYLAGQLLPSSLATPRGRQNLATTHLVNMLSLCYEHTCANAELIVDFN